MTTKTKSPALPSEPKKAQFAVAVMLDEQNPNLGSYHMQLWIFEAANEMEARGMALTGALAKHPTGAVKSCIALRVP